MKISQLIAALQKIQEKEGDLEIGRPNGMGSVYKSKPALVVDSVRDFGDEIYESNIEPILYRHCIKEGKKENRTNILLIK